MFIRGARAFLYYVVFEFYLVCLVGVITTQFSDQLSFCLVDIVSTVFLFLFRYFSEPIHFLSSLFFLRRNN